MRATTLITFILFSLATTAQRPAPDIVNGISIQPVLHGSVVISNQKHTIYVDPYGGAQKYSGLQDPDIILITHTHGDHLNKETLDGINTSAATFVVPQSVADELPPELKKNMHILANNESTSINGVLVEAVPMYNLPDDESSRHKKGWGNGYVVTIDNTKFYFSGDTEDIPEMRSLNDINVAFVCMNLPYTMNVEQAADAVLDFNPDIVYPYHYRGNPDMSDTSLFKDLVNKGNEKIDVRLRDWYMK